MLTFSQTYQFHFGDLDQTSKSYQDPIGKIKLKCFLDVLFLSIRVQTLCKFYINGHNREHNALLSSFTFIYKGDNSY